MTLPGGGWDWVVVNSSGGKDSQVTLDVVASAVEASGHPRDRVVVVHCDLGRVEWAGTRELAAEQAARYGFRFEVVRRPGRDLLDEVAARGKWPSSTARYCTSYYKRDQVAKLHTRLAREVGGKRGLGRPVRILNCMGMRAAESPARGKLEPLAVNPRASSGEREVTDWLPIHGWSTAEVWERIRATGVPHHPAYDLGMPRLSCAFCIFAPKAALVTAGRANPGLLRDYVAVERLIGHRFRQGLSIAEVAAEVDAGAQGVEAGCTDAWNM